MKKMILLVMIGVGAQSILAFPIGDIAFRVCVVDEGTGLPIDGARVVAAFDDTPTSWGETSTEKIERGITDANGYCRFHGTSNHGMAGYRVEQIEGYYATDFVTYTATNQVRNFLSYKCEPYDCIYTTALQRVEHPVPLYVKAVKLCDRDGIGGFDGTNAVLRYDFVAGDWLPPEGKGEHADMEIRTKYELKETVMRGMHPLSFFEFTSEIEFPGEGNGLVEKSVKGMNCGIRIRQAPSDGYANQKVLRFGRRQKETKVKGVWPDVYTESDKDRCYSFRIRSRFDDNGRLIEALYGKIYNDFGFEGSDKGGFTGVNFIYYLNAKSLDRNLEWDMENNLNENPDKGRAYIPREP